jgi:hypothetical protein
MQAKLVAEIYVAILTGAVGIAAYAERGVTEHETLMTHAQ